MKRRHYKDFSLLQVGCLCSRRKNVVGCQNSWPERSNQSTSGWDWPLFVFLMASLILESKLTINLISEPKTSDSGTSFSNHWVKSRASSSNHWVKSRASSSNHWEKSRASSSNHWAKNRPSSSNNLLKSRGNSSNPWVKNGPSFSNNWVNSRTNSSLHWVVLPRSLSDPYTQFLSYWVKSRTNSSVHRVKNRSTEWIVEQVPQYAMELKKNYPHI